MSGDVPHSLLVDLYELTMVDVYRREGMADQRATFSLFVRTLPPGRGYLVAAGLDDALGWLEQLRFGPRELEALRRLDLFDRGFLDWLADLRFTGDVRALAEGTLVFPQEPIIEVDAPLGEAQLAETFLLNQLTLQTVLATKAARCRHAARGAAVVDFALRRTPGIDAGMKLARVGALVGLTATSNVAGADRYGLAVTGTMAHSFVQAHGHEIDAFRSFTRASGGDTVLLVDTYESHRGIERAIAVAAEARQRGTEIRGIRLDSGDLAALARHARRRLDEEGFPRVQVFASGGLDERDIHRLVEGGAPIDGFGVGSALSSTDFPTLDSVYKLVAYSRRAVRKTSPAKEIWPGAKQVWRARDWSQDILCLAEEPPPGHGYRPLLVEVMGGGSRTTAGRVPLEEGRRHFEREWGSAPQGLKDLEAPSQHAVVVSGRLRALADELDTRDSEEEP